MGRRAKPWFRKDRGAWYTKIDGKMVRLASGRENRAEAERVFRQLQAQERPARSAAGLLSGEVCDLYHAHAHRHLAAVTAGRYADFLGAFARTCGRTPAASLKPRDVTAWLDGRPSWGATTRANAVAVVKRAFAWAARQGHIERDPIAGLERPRAKRREVVIDAAGAQTLIDAAACPEFRDLLVVLRETGCRPGEAIRVEAKHIDWSRRLAVLEGKTSAKTGRPRAIHLTERATAILAAWAEIYPEGPLIRNTKGRPWTRAAINCQMRRLRARAGLKDHAGAVLYALRHLWITDALEAGAPIASVAELAGQRSTAMIERHYSHLTERTEHLRSILDRVRPGVTNGADGRREEGPG